MKAIICTRYGPPDVLQLRDVAKPAPSDQRLFVVSPEGVQRSLGI